MNIAALFTSKATRDYKQDLKERVQTTNDDLDSATRRLLHAAGRAINDGKQDIFTEFAQGLERRGHARTVSN